MGICIVDTGMIWVPQDYREGLKNFGLTFDELACSFHLPTAQGSQGVARNAKTCGHQWVAATTLQVRE